MKCLIITIISLIFFLGYSASANELEGNELGSITQFINGKTPANRIYFAMFTLHPSKKQIEDDRWNNELFGFNYKSLFVGTFLNSFSERSYVVALQRDLYVLNKGSWDISLGYRLGIVYGYKDGQAIKFSKYSCILPFPQFYANFTYHCLGVEVSNVANLLVTGIYFQI